jgi:hypothetical protein
MKTWIVSALVATALAAAAATAAPASAHDQWNDGHRNFGWNVVPGWQSPGWKGDGWRNPGWNGGVAPWLGYNNPAWPAPNGCVFDRRGDGWDCDQWDHGGKKKFVSERTIITQVYRAGYRHVFDIDRDGNRYRVTAVDFRGRHVLLTFNARTGGFIKKRFL